MKKIKIKNFLIFISIVLIVWATYWYNASRLLLISEDILKLNELVINHKGNTFRIKNLVFHAEQLPRDTCDNSDLESLIEWTYDISNQLKELKHNSKFNKSDTIENSTNIDVNEYNQDLELSQFYTLDIDLYKDIILTMVIYTDRQDRIKAVELERFISPFESYNEFIYYNLETGLIYHVFEEYTTKSSGFNDSMDTKGKGYYTLVCNKSIVKSFNVSSINDQNIIKSVYGMKKLSKRIISKINE